MSVYNDKQRAEHKAKLKQEQEAELKKVETKAKYKNITEIKTLDELLEYYYVVPKIITYEEYEGLNIKDVLEQVTLKTRGKTNINLVKRGKKHKKLTKEQEQEIRQSNLSNAKLSKIYGVSSTTIFRIKHKEE